MTRRLPSAAQIVIVFSIALLPWAEYLLTTGLPCYRDAGRYFIPDKIALAQALRSGAFPFWDGSRAGGLPWFADFQTQLFYPLAAVFHLFPIGAAITSFAVLHVIAAALGGLLALTAWRMRAAALGALVFSLSGFCRTSLDTLTTFSSLMWIPVILLLTLGGRNRWQMLTGGLALASLALAGIPDQVILMLLGWMILGTGLKTRSIRRRMNALGWLTLGLVPALPQILAGLEFVVRSDRWLSPVAGASTIWSLRPGDLSAWFLARATRPESVADYWISQHWLGSPYLGVTTGLLIVTAFVGGRRPAALARSGIAAPYWLALALMVALGLGGGGPVWEGAGRLIPGLAAVRYPVKTATWITWLFAWLAAASAVRIAEGCARGVITVLLFTVAADLLWLGPAGPALIPSSYYTAPARLDPTLRAGGGRVFIEPRTFHDLEVLVGPTLQSALWSAREFRPPNLHRLAGFDSLQTYGSMDLAGHARFNEGLTRMTLGPAITGLREAGVGSVISAARLPHPDLLGEVNAQDAPFVYRVKTPWPMVRRTREPRFDEPPSALPMRVEVLRDDWYRITTAGDEPGWIVAAENWFPGWVAVIVPGDAAGRAVYTVPQPIEPFGQATAAPPGKCEMTLRYVTRRFGGSIGLAAVALAAMAWLGTKRMKGLPAD